MLLQIIEAKERVISSTGGEEMAVKEEGKFRRTALRTRGDWSYQKQTGAMAGGRIGS